MFLRNSFFSGCLGQNKPWPNLEFGTDPEKVNAPSDFRVPPDLIRNGSYTSLKVFKGAPPIVTKKYKVEVDLSISEEERKHGVYGKQLDYPLLGNYHSFPPKLCRKKKLQPLDETTNNIPVFRYLTMAPWKMVKRVSTPDCIRKINSKARKKASTADYQSGSYL